MVLWSRNSDRTGERYWHATAACLVAAAGMAIIAAAGGSAVIAIAGLSLTAFGVSAAKPPLWCIPTMFFGGTAAAAAIGFINSLGTLGGFAGPYMVGASESARVHFSRGLYFVGGTLLVSAVTIMVLKYAVQRGAPQTIRTGDI
jgi:ACS family tartrate transporter-like MFS transporter